MTHETVLAGPRDPSCVDTATWRALGTYVHLGVRDVARLADFVAVARAVLTDVDRTCSRFRADSDLSRVNATPGSWVSVDELLIAALKTALAVAEQTDGLVSPLLGRTIVELGYDRDFAQLKRVSSAPVLHPVAADAWQRVEIDGLRVRIPEGSSLDLGCTGKPFAADLIAGLAGLEEITGIVSLGGDLAVAGPDGEPFEVAISTAPGAPADAWVGLVEGGLATSSTRVRRWVAGAATQHHLIDPRSGGSAAEVWHTVSAVGRSATAANAASTAAVVLGQDAPAWLAAHQVAARLVADDGVLTTGGWPTDPTGPTGPADPPGPAQAPLGIDEHRGGTR